MCQDLRATEYRLEENRKPSEFRETHESTKSTLGALKTDISLDTYSWKVSSINREGHLAIQVSKQTVPDTTKIRIKLAFLKADQFIRVTLPKTFTPYYRPPLPAVSYGPVFSIQLRSSGQAKAKERALRIILPSIFKEDISSLVFWRTNTGKTC